MRNTASKVSRAVTKSGLPGRLGSGLFPGIESSAMWGDGTGSISAEFGQAVVLRQRMVLYGFADRKVGNPPSVEHAKPFGSLLRRVYALLSTIAVTIVLAKAIEPRIGTPTAGLGMSRVDWLLPAMIGGSVVGVVLVLSSGSWAGLALVTRLGLPTIGPRVRAGANGLIWAAVAVLAVHFTSTAFDVMPGGHRLVAILLGLAVGFGTYRLHQHSIAHDTYRTFNLVALLLATGSLASMSITPTGQWWTHNFSTLGTSNDLAAVCFNVAVAASGAGMAGLSGAMTRALEGERFALRRGGAWVVRILIILIGASLMGVGLVPINGNTDLHNSFAGGAAGAFALLCTGVQLWAARPPRTLVAFSYAALLTECVAMFSYADLGLFNLTVFEVVAFTLVFAWLIALVATTSSHEHAHEAVAAPATEPHRMPPRRRTVSVRQPSSAPPLRRTGSRGPASITRRHAPSRPRSMGFRHDHRTG